MVVVRARTARSGYVDLKLGVRVIKPVRPHAVLFVNCECGASTPGIDPNVPPHRTNKAGELEFDNSAGALTVAVGMRRVDAMPKGAIRVIEGATEDSAELLVGFDGGGGDWDTDAAWLHVVNAEA